MKKISRLTPQEEYRVVQASLQDPKEFRTLYDLYYADVFRFILSKTGDTVVTGETASTVFYKAITKLSSFKFTGRSIKNWLLTIAYNEVMQYSRSEKASRLVSVEEQELHLIAEDIDEPDGLNIEMLIPLLNDLNDEELSLVELRYFDRNSFKEIAEIMELTEANTRVRVHRVIKKMQKQIIKEI